MMGVIRNILIFVFFLLCFGTMFLTSSFFINTHTTPKQYWMIFSGSIMVIGLLALHIIGKTIILTEGLFTWFYKIIGVLCLLQALYGIMQFANIIPVYGRFKVVGSFDNPAGFAACLSAGFPFYFNFAFVTKNRNRYFNLCSMIIVGFAILISGSRAGIVAMTVVCVTMFFRVFILKIKFKIIILIVLSILMISLYFLKKDSANGRLLIWQCCWEMIKDSPLIGHGSNGFKANYMDYQAHFFERNPNSKYVMLADNINSPFNEYIAILVNYGLLGFSILFLLIYLLIRKYKRYFHKNPQLQSTIAYLSIVSIAIFAFFSYPLRYPFVLVVGVLSCINILLPQNLPINTVLPTRFFSLMLLSVVMAVCVERYGCLKAEIKWANIVLKSMLGQTEQMLPEYGLLHSKLYKNELFLYNYAAELNYSKNFDQSLLIAYECERLWADYDLQMLIADNYQQLKKYDEAELHYKKAANMCPVKFLPLYKLFQLYEITNHKDNMEKMAMIITDKPVKVMSVSVSRIKDEVKRKTDRLW